MSFNTSTTNCSAYHLSDLLSFVPEGDYFGTLMDPAPIDVLLMDSRFVFPSELGFKPLNRSHMDIASTDEGVFFGKSRVVSYNNLPCGIFDLAIVFAFFGKHYMIFRGSVTSTTKAIGLYTEKDDFSLNQVSERYDIGYVPEGINSSYSFFYCEDGSCFYYASDMVYNGYVDTVDSSDCHVFPYTITCDQFQVLSNCSRSVGSVVLIDRYHTVINVPMGVSFLFKSLRPTEYYSFKLAYYKVMDYLSNHNTLFGPKLLMLGPQTFVSPVDVVSFPADVSVTNENKFLSFHHDEKILDIPCAIKEETFRHFVDKFENSEFVDHEQFLAGFSLGEIVDRSSRYSFFDKVLERGGVLLDYGYSDPIFGRKVARKLSMNFYGYDPNDSVGFDAVHHSTAFPPGTFDVIILNHYLHHVSDVSSVIQMIKRLLKVGGLLIIKEHNVDSVSAYHGALYEHFLHHKRYSKRADFLHYIFDDNIFNFSSKKSLIGSLRRAGFDLSYLDDTLEKGGKNYLALFRYAVKTAFNCSNLDANFHYPIHVNKENKDFFNWWNDNYQFGLIPLDVKFKFPKVTKEIIKIFSNGLEANVPYPYDSLFDYFSSFNDMLTHDNFRPLYHSYRRNSLLNVEVFQDLVGYAECKDHIMNYHYG